MTFIGSQNSDDNTLLAIDNASGAASGVGIEILENSGVTLPMGTASADVTLLDGSNTMTYKARYKSTAVSVTAGPANASTDFQVSYK